MNSTAFQARAKQLKDRMLGGLAVLVLALAGVVAVPQASEAATARKAVTVAAATSKSQVLRGTAVKISGTVKFRVTKRAAKGIKVRVQQRPVGSTRWTRVKTVRTNTRGKLALSVRPTKSTYYRVQVLKTPKIGAKTSAARLVKVTQPRPSAPSKPPTSTGGAAGNPGSTEGVTVTSMTKNVEMGGFLTITGTTTAGLRGSTLTFLRWGDDDGLVQVGTAAVSTNGGFSASFKPGRSFFNPMRNVALYVRFGGTSQIPITTVRVGDYDLWDWYDLVDTRLFGPASLGYGYYSGAPYEGAPDGGFVYSMFRQDTNTASMTVVRQLDFDPNTTCDKAKVTVFLFNGTSENARIGAQLMVDNRSTWSNNDVTRNVPYAIDFDVAGARQVAFSGSVQYSPNDLHQYADLGWYYPKIHCTTRYSR